MILHSQIIGEGSPFIVLHGFLGMSDNWKTLGKKFAELGYEIHLVDQRNHGRSFHADSFSYDLMAQDLLAYCEHYNIESTVVLGHSMGGKTAMAFATQHPDMVNQLIIADIAPKQYPSHHQDILKGLDALDFSTLKQRSDADAQLAYYVKDIGVRQFLLKNLYWVEKGQLGLRINLNVLAASVAEIGKELSKDATFNKDTLFIRGGNSGYIEDLDRMSIEKHFPKATIETIEHAGHWLHAENPTKFLEIIANFLQKEV